MSKNIMIVDDSATVRQVLRITLEDGGYDVTEAVDGQDALEQLSSQRFDMIVTDLQMPKLDGLSLIREVRKKTCNSHTPIVVLTTESKAEIKAEGKAAGVLGWIVKPFKPEQILSVVHTICPI